MAHNETRNGLNETERVPRTWSRSTVADGQWMQKNTLGPYRNSDWFLASAIDNLLDKDDELTQAIADESAARAAYDLFLSQSATQIRSDLDYTSGKLADEIGDRLAYDEFLAGSATQIRSDLDTVSSNLDTEIQTRASDDIKVRTSAFNYTDTASAFLNNEINYVSATFNDYSAGIATWQENTIKPALKNLNDLTETVNALEGASDVFDVVATTADLDGYSARLTPKAIIKVLSAGENNDEQWYYRWKGTKTTAAVFHLDDFSAVGHVAAYYSQAEINDMFGDYYKKAETSSSQQLTTKFNNYYTTSQMDTMLGNKLNTSAEYINDAQFVVETGKILSISKVKVQSQDRYFPIAATCDINGDSITNTYMYASAAYKKNETSGKDQLNAAFENKLDTSAAFEGHIKYNHQGGAPDVYDLGDLWYEYGFTTPPEETKVNNNQDDVIVYAYPKDDQAYSARRYIGCFKRRKEIQLYNKVLEAWQLLTDLPDFEHYPNTYFII